jgi:hypothetical protein
MFILARALTYAVFFVGFFLVVLPARVLSSAGVARPPVAGAWQMAGLSVAGVGALLALACIVAFVFVGGGTQAPFDPPRRLVVRGPYRFIRNPMYVGASAALAGAALFYRSMSLAAYACGFLLVLAPVRHVVRGTRAAPDVRRGVRRVLRPHQEMVAERPQVSPPSPGILCASGRCRKIRVTPCLHSIKSSRGDVRSTNIGVCSRSPTMTSAR